MSRIARRRVNRAMRFFDASLARAVLCKVGAHAPEKCAGEQRL